MIEDLIIEANRRGLLVNNLFQINAEAWQANVRGVDDSGPWEFGRGLDAEAALRDALDRVGEGPVTFPPIPDQFRRDPAENDLLA